MQKVLGLDIKPVTDAIAKALSGLVPGVPPGASAPVALVEAEQPTIVCNMPAIRPTEPSTSAPAAAAAAPTDVADEATPAPALDGPAPQRVAVELTAPTEPDAVLTPARVAHRGPAESADDTSAVATTPVARHRGGSDASPAAAERAGR